MSEKASQLRIGIFVLGGVAIVLAGLFVFGLRSALRPTYTFETYLEGDVDGLSVGSPVKLRGVVIGKVTEIGFSWNLYQVGEPMCVVVRGAFNQAVSPLEWRADFQSQSESSVAHGLRAVIQSEGFTGAAVVSFQVLDPAKYPPLRVPWTPRYWYVPSAPSQFGRLLASVERTLTTLEKLDLATLSRNLDETVLSAGAALKTADRTLKRLGELDVKSISRGASGTLESANAAAEEVKQLAADARQELKALHLSTVSADADHLLSSLDGRLAVLIDRLSAVDVRSLNETLAGTREAAQRLNEVLQELRRYPPGFLFGGPPPPAAEVEKK